MKTGTRNTKIVVIGGGTGSFALLSGLKHHYKNLTALVSMADSGGSTGRLRDELGVLPPGDVRKCLVALANVPQMRDLFNYRFSNGTLDGHSFGNIFLSTVEKMTDNFTEAVDLAGKLLNITGRVLPVTKDKTTLVIEQPGGETIRGEAALDHQALHLDHPNVHLEPKARLTPEGKQAILEADAIIIAPGSLYGSLAAVLVVEGVAKALAKSKAKKIYICNLATEPGQTNDFKVHDFVGEVERFLDQKVALDYVLYNTHRPEPKLMKRYMSQQQFLVEYDDAQFAGQHYQAIGGNYVAEHVGPIAHAKFIRHNTEAMIDTLHNICRK